MRFVLACYGSRGDIEPCAATGLELQHRDMKCASQSRPNLVGFVSRLGLPAIAYGPDSRAA